MLEIDALHHQRGEEGQAFRLSVGNIRILRGQCVAVVGPSGSGKSTLLDIMGLVMRPKEARRFRILADDEFDIVALWNQGHDGRLADVRAREIGYLLQTGGLIPFLTVAENIEIPQRLLGQRDGSFIADLTGRLGIKQKMAAKPRALSIGERQRVAIARSLAHRPRLLLADEPTASLDPENAWKVMELLTTLARDSETAVVIVTHDGALVESYADRKLEITRQTDCNGRSTSVIGGGAAGEPSVCPLDD